MHVECLSHRREMSADKEVELLVLCLYFLAKSSVSEVVPVLILDRKRFISITTAAASFWHVLVLIIRLFRLSTTF